MPDDDTPLMDVLADITASALERSSLDVESMMLVRLAALVAVDAPAASYLLNLTAASEAGVTEEQVEGVLIAIAPVVGTARIVSATGNITRALGFAIGIALDELEAELEAEEGSPRQVSSTERGRDAGHGTVDRGAVGRLVPPAGDRHHDLAPVPHMSGVDQAGVGRQRTDRRARGRQR